MDTRVIQRHGLLVFLILIIAVMSVAPVGATPLVQDDGDTPPDPELVAYGEYLAEISGCRGCHTPVNEDHSYDYTRAYQGGQVFDLGPLGTVTTQNLTSDDETGLGTWTDEEIKIATTTGITPDGRHLFPVSPYPLYNNMAESDLDAIVAFLRTLEPITASYDDRQVLPPEQLPHIPRRVNNDPPPDGSDAGLRGAYLLSAILTCTDCHTPIDPETGLAMVERAYLSGGQPYEGPWGTVYAANLTPHETGLDSWSDDEIKAAIRTGLLPSGRVAIFMPWTEYASLTDDDLDAVIFYLRNDLQPVDNVVPAAALNEEFAVVAESPEPEQDNSLTIAIVIGGVLGLLIIGAISRRSQQAQS